MEKQMSYEERQELEKQRQAINSLEVLRLWKELKVEEAVFEFDCGGDSMGDTDLSATDKEGNSIDLGELRSILEDEVYNRVQFYDASDGHYQGESGNVVIIFDEGDDELQFMKSAEAEFSERLSGQFDLKVSDEEYEFLNKYVENINYSPWDSENINYKTDLILTDELESLQQDLIKRIEDESYYIEPEDVPYGAERNEDGVSFHTGEDFDDDTTIQLVKKFDDATNETNHYLKVWVEVEYTVFRPSED
jgi:hypothetical protein